MNIDFRQAVPHDSEAIAALVVKLTTEICQLTSSAYFDINLNDTSQRCHELLTDGHYAAIIGFYDNSPVAVATMTETYALYVGGKIGVIQEFYVANEFRASGLGTLLIEQVKAHGLQRNWSCIELCTPPLPEFERTLNFYQNNGMNPVGGRKMRLSLV